jgi:hypothetical protein
VTPDASPDGGTVVDAMTTPLGAVGGVAATVVVVLDGVLVLDNASVDGGIAGAPIIACCATAPGVLASVGKLTGVVVD